MQFCIFIGVDITEFDGVIDNAVYAFFISFQNPLPVGGCSHAHAGKLIQQGMCVGGEDLCCMQVLVALNAGAGQIQNDFSLMICDQLPDLGSGAGTGQGDVEFAIL